MVWRAAGCQSLQQKFGYWLSLVHPSQVAAAAIKVDEVLRRVLEQVADFSILLRVEDLSYTCPVDVLGGASFQAVLCGLPIK